jgi:cytochrome c
MKEGDNRLGPNLYKVVGRKAGSLPNYGYSSAMQDRLCLGQSNT